MVARLNNPVWLSYAYIKCLVQTSPRWHLAGLSSFLLSKFFRPYFLDGQKEWKVIAGSRILNRKLKLISQMMQGICVFLCSNSSQSEFPLVDIKNAWVFYYQTFSATLMETGRLTELKLFLSLFSFPSCYPDAREIDTLV